VDSSEKDQNGQLRTWVGTEAGVILKEDSSAANERFAIDPDSFFLFSSVQSTMMLPLRIEKTFATDTYVMESRSKRQGTLLHPPDPSRVQNPAVFEFISTFKFSFHATIKHM
jgi:hypothetical protein